MNERESHLLQKFDLPIKMTFIRREWITEYALIVYSYIICLIHSRGRDDIFMMIASGSGPPHADATSFWS